MSTFRAILLCLVLSPGLASASRQDEWAPPRVALGTVRQDFYPLKDGLKWTYANDDGTESVKKVGAKKTVDGVECVAVQGFGPLGVFRDETAFMVVTKEGVKIHRIAEFKDILWLRIPLKPGDKWKSGLFETEVLGEEEVQVPAGKYKTVKVRTRFGDEEGTSGEWIAWYATGVGEVKSAFTMTDRKKAKTVNRALKKLEGAEGK